ncbi:hypothetical protein [Kitasatospora sp. NPDC050463]|uniref:hypothetical protein n=1 Tax=Kitasatospora sp. NPDC050463 TaxID=3155786 RepID=UPI0033DAD6F9
MSLNSEGYGLEGLPSRSVSFWKVAVDLFFFKGHRSAQVKAESGRKPATGLRPGAAAAGNLVNDLRAGICLVKAEEVSGRRGAAGPRPADRAPVDLLWEIAPYAQRTVECEIDVLLAELNESDSPEKEELAYTMLRLAELVEMRQGEQAAALWFRCAAALGSKDARDYVENYL